MSCWFAGSRRWLWISARVRACRHAWRAAARCTRDPGRRARVGERAGALLRLAPAEQLVCGSLAFAIGRATRDATQAALSAQPSSLAFDSSPIRLGGTTVRRNRRLVGELRADRCSGERRARSNQPPPRRCSRARRRRLRPGARWAGGRLAPRWTESGLKRFGGVVAEPQHLFGRAVLPGRVAKPTRPTEIRRLDS